MSSAKDPLDWPASSRFGSRKEGCLVVFLHPGCPCSVSTIHQLERLSATAGDRFESLVFISGPREESSDLQRSAIAELATTSGVTLVEDPKAAEATKFHATVSGETFFYRSGNLLFHGGITPARGHEGDCIGTELVATLFAQETLLNHHVVKTPYFGCTLR